MPRCFDLDQQLNIASFGILVQYDIDYCPVYLLLVPGLEKIVIIF